MYYKILINIILIILLAVFQFSFISSLPFYLKYINLEIIALIFILNLLDYKYVFWWAIGFGLFFDVISFSFFGINLIAYSAVITGLNYLFINYFTDRSFYSFSILTVIGILLFKIIISSLTVLMAPDKLINFLLIKNMIWPSLFLDIGINLLAMAIIFYISSTLLKSLNPAFLIKKKK